jgi:hypothetical protein
MPPGVVGTPRALSLSLSHQTQLERPRRRPHRRCRPRQILRTAHIERRRRRPPCHPLPTETSDDVVVFMRLQRELETCLLKPIKMIGRRQLFRRRSALRGLLQRREKNEPHGADRGRVHARSHYDRLRQDRWPANWTEK